MSLLRTDWPTAPLGRLVSINERALAETTDPGYTFRYLDISSVGRGEIVEEPTTLRFEDAPSRARRILRRGDTAVSTVRTYLRAVLPIRDDASDLIASTGFAVLSPGPGIDSRFLSWYAQSDPFIEEVVARSVGVSYPAIAPSELGQFPLPTPALAGQRAIADFLDAETARIDALIAKKRRLARLLGVRYREERRVRVLRKLDPITGSGLDIPDWHVAHLGVLIGLQRGHDLPIDHRNDGTVPVISSGGPSGWHDEAAAMGPGVVTGRYGTIGEVYYVDGPYWPLNTTLYVHDFRSHDPRWVYHLLSVLPLDSDSAKSAVTGINRNVIGVLRVPVPPLYEQRRLAKELDAKACQLESLTSRLDAQIKLLAEHRQALITAAVTGQLGVSGATAS